MKRIVVDHKKTRRRCKPFGLRRNKARIVRVEQPRLSEHQSLADNPHYDCREC
jgi:hypothetical protein